MPGWLAALVIGRDLVIVGGAVAYYYLIGHFDAAPSRLSKLTTLVQIVFVLAELLRLSHLIEMPDAVRTGAIAFTALLTFASGAHYVVVWSARAWRTHACARTEAGVSGNTLDIRWQWLILIGIVGFVIWLLAPVLMPFVIAALFAYLGDPLVDRLEKRMTRTLAVCLVFLVMVDRRRRDPARAGAVHRAPDRQFPRAAADVDRCGSRRRPRRGSRRISAFRPTCSTRSS